MKKLLPLILALSAVLCCLWLVQADENSEKKPLRILLVIGGCCHDYAMQKTILEVGIESRIHADVVVEYTEDTSTGATFPIYEKDDWAEGFDVVLHDECSAAVNDPAYVGRILQAHLDGVPAVNIHCAMHSYRWGMFKEPVAVGADNAGWFEMIGIQSSRHGPKAPIDLTFTDKEHPITVGMQDWTTIDEELYNNLKTFDAAHPLVSGKQIQFPKPKKGKPADPNAVGTEANAVVAWTNLYGPKETKIFSTTLGHFNETVADDRYLDLVTRGLLWVSGNLAKDGTAANGYAK